MSKVLFLINFLIILPILIIAQESKGVKIELVNLKNELEPGKIHTVVYKVANYSDAVMLLTPGLRLPADWKVISELKHISVSPGSQVIILISFNIPTKYQSGTYTFDFMLVDPNNYEKVIASMQSSLKVKEEPVINLEIAEVPEFLRAGEIINASYIVRNNGNTQEAVTFETYGCRVLGAQSILLQPGESSVVKVSSSTDLNTTYLNRKSFYLTAKGNKFKTDPLYGFVNIIPVKEEENDLYHRFPVTVATRYLAKGRDSIFNKGFQFEISGAGSLDAKGEHKLEFLGRGPNQFDMSLLGLYDEYRLEYTNKFMGIKIGDESYSMTQLTEYARYGTGFESKFKLTDKIETGALFVKPRFYNKIKSEFGIYSTIELIKNARFGAHYLHKNLPGDSKGVDLFSITSQLKPLERTDIELELSRGYTKTSADNAYRAVINSQFHNFSLSAYLVKTGKNYPGYYTNSDFYSGYINYNPAQWLSLGLSARQDFVNAELDTLFLTAPMTRNYQGSVIFKIGNRMFFKSYVRQVERDDRSPDKKFHYTTESFVLSLAHRLKEFGYNLEGEFGKTHNLLIQDGTDKKNTFQGTGNVYYNPGQKLFIQAMVSYSNVQSFIYEQQNDWIVGLNVSSEITSKLRANLQLQNSYSIEDYYSNRNLFQLDVDYRFLKHHTLTATSYYTLFQSTVSKPEFSFVLTYSVDFGIPLKKIAEAGSVHGRIDNFGAEKTKGIILSLAGKTAVTNENGEFEFKNLKPGKYNLLIDRSTVGFNDIPNVITPIEVEVIGNQTTSLNFGLTLAAKISGKIEADLDESAKDIQREQLVGHIVLELTKENESIKIISDSDGNFEFPLIRPGKWFLKVYSNTIDKQYTFEKDYMDLEMSPGG